MTAYKEVIRLLTAQPTEPHIEMIMHEWNRAELHRDVRIVILQAAIAVCGCHALYTSSIYLMTSSVTEV